MDTVYIIMALLGWPFLVLFMLSGAGADIDFDTDTDLGIGDTDIDVDLDTGGTSLLGTIASWISFRSLVFFAAFFGLTGVVLGWLDTPPVVTLIAALVMGGFAVWLNRALIDYIRRTDSDSLILDEHIAGLPASVAVPFGGLVRGKISVDVEGQRLSFVAEPFRSGDDTYAIGDTVVIVEIEAGVAKVAPFEDPMST